MSSMFEDTKQEGKVTLDSGAGVSVWPREKMKGVKLLPKKKCLWMVAANGTETSNNGQEAINFRGLGGEEQGG